MDDYANRVLLGKSLEVLRQLPDTCIDAVVTDPPYGLGTKEPTVEQLVAFLQGADLDTGGDFMGQKWEVPSVLAWQEVYRVLKPGAHVLSFGGTRAWDLISLGLRAAGFEYRDTISDEYPSVPGLQWVHGQGFPKSLNVSKVIDKEAGAEREVIGTYRVSGNALTPTSVKGGTYVTGAPNSPSGELEITAPATAEAKMWDGYGTALKPAWEPILMFRKPLDGKVIDNVREHGTGAINIDACRVGTHTETHASRPRAPRNTMIKGMATGTQTQSFDHGRWPSNLVLAHAPGCRQVGFQKVKSSPLVRFTDGAKPFGGGAGHPHERVPTGDENEQESVPIWECIEGCPVKMLDEQSGVLTTNGIVSPYRNQAGYGGYAGIEHTPRPTDSGGASRFFSQFEGVHFRYEAKPSKRETQLDGLIHNDHPTKKPLELMRWLVKLVCPKGGIVLDPYCGSGSTLHAACEEGMRYVGIDNDPHAVEIAQARMDIVEGREQERQSELSAFDAAMGLGDED